MNHIELTLTFSQNRWIVKNDLLTSSAPTLEELDIKVKHLLLENQIIKSGEKVKILMAFDNATIPQWIRQYSQHYFNRIVEVEG